MDAQIFFIVLAVLFFAPAWLAAPGRRLTILVALLVFGWTGIGWGIALVMSARSWEKRRV